MKRLSKTIGRAKGEAPRLILNGDALGKLDGLSLDTGTSSRFAGRSCVADEL